MGEFKKYRCVQVSEMREVTAYDIEVFRGSGCLVLEFVVL